MYCELLEDGRTLLDRVNAPESVPLRDRLYSVPVFEYIAVGLMLDCTEVLPITIRVVFTARPLLVALTDPTLMLYTLLANMPVVFAMTAVTVALLTARDVSAERVPSALILSVAVALATPKLPFGR